MNKEKEKAGSKAAKNLSETEIKKDGPKRGKGVPFQKGFDKRRNLKGALKPRSQRELEDLLDKIFDEDVINRDGETITKLEELLNRLMTSKNVLGGIYTIDRRFGKLKETLDTNINANVTNVITIIDKQEGE